MAEEKRDEISIDKSEFVNETAAEEAIMGAAFSSGEDAVPAKIFLDDDARIRIEVDIYSDKKTGKIVNVFRKGSFNNEDIEKILGHTEVYFEFSVPAYDDVVLYRQQSSNNPQRVIDRNVFRSFLLVMHLKDWSLTDDDGNKIILKFDTNGGLTSKSTRVVNRVPVVVWDMVLTLFERESLIS